MFWLNKSSQYTLIYKSTALPQRELEYLVKSLLPKQLMVGMSISASSTPQARACPPIETDSALPHRNKRTRIASSSFIQSSTSSRSERYLLWLLRHLKSRVTLVGWIRCTSTETSRASPPPGHWILHERWSQAQRSLTLEYARANSCTCLSLSL